MQVGRDPSTPSTINLIIPQILVSTIYASL
jgi:hypothetical protein